ncbi:MAG TPA: DNA replication and repair protein RecF [Rhodothermales bacterium]|nr:DNA replication and repair protein RecF [Rhodothermales bacterium]
MRIRSLHLVSFRAHNDNKVTFARKVNLLFGPNGAGKTNILEAIHYLCLSKSFLATRDTYALQEGAPFFELDGQFESERGRELSVRLVYVPAEGKRVLVNRAPLERLSQIVGQLPVVVFSPEDQVLTAGGPEERRRFMDNILSQARPVYLDDLISYRRALKQRNELLLRHRRGRGAGLSDEVLNSWTAELVVLGSRIVAMRLRFVSEFKAFLEKAFSCIEGGIEDPTLTYETITPLEPDATIEEIEHKFGGKLTRVSRREREVGRTLAGPHLDEIIFRTNGREVRRYASQGQHRTFGMAIKLAQYFYLADRLEESPILLLDDVFGNLDPERTRVLMMLLQTEAVGQSIITTAHAEPLLAHLAFDESTSKAMEVVGGCVVAPV